MGVAIALRVDFDGATLRRLARKTKNANQSRRLLALAEIYDGGFRSDAARIGGVGLQIVRDWVVRFNARGSEALIDGKARGQQPKLNDAQRQALVAIVESGPIPAIHGVVRWRLIDLAQWLYAEFAVSLDETTVGQAEEARLCQAHGAAAPSRARHRRAGGVRKAGFATELEKVRARLPQGTAIEIWFQE